MDFSPKDLADLTALARQAAADPALRAEVGRLIAGHRYDFTQKVVTASELLSEYVAGLGSMDDAAFSDPATILEAHKLFVSAWHELRGAAVSLHAIEEFAAARKFGEAE